MGFGTALLSARTGCEKLAGVISPGVITTLAHILVQFHPEITPELLGSWIKEDASDFERTSTDPDAVLEETVRLQPEARRRAADLFDRFVAGVTANS